MYLQTHSTDVVFCLVVDDFGVKYRSPEQAKHLMDTLKLMYTVKEDWTGGAYAGSTFNKMLSKGQSHCPDTLMTPLKDL
jgi:hypothetical protein